MAKGLLDTTDPQKRVATGIPSSGGYEEQLNQARNRYASNQQTGPYRGGLQSNFDFGHYTSDASLYDDPSKAGYASGAFSDADSDVRNAANASFELQNPNEGTNSAEQRALLNMYQGRIGQKNALAEQIANSERLQKEQENLLKGAAGQALGEGLKGTRENANSRGMLYSGLRQAGEQKVQQGVASGLDSSISGSRRESANAKQSAMSAYASVGLANQQESMQLAHEAFDTATRNSIARLQAFQQLGQAAGGVAGMVYGSRGTPSASTGAAGGGNSYSVEPGNSYSADLGARSYDQIMGR